MSLNIKNPETYRLAKELADQTGESMTSAVTEAIRERLDRIKFKQSREGMADEILAIATEMNARLPKDFFDIEHGDLLYDEYGLPK